MMTPEWVRGGYWLRPVNQDALGNHGQLVQLGVCITECWLKRTDMANPAGGFIFAVFIFSLPILGLRVGYLLDEGTASTIEHHRTRRK